jgi:hypothetical protein
LLPYNLLATQSETEVLDGAHADPGI